jgi:hypothetical protein
MWPDWSGQDVAIIASGPSAKSAGVALLNGRMRVIAIKKNIEIAPFADVVYGCDGPWWRSVRGLPDFKGLKLAYDAAVCSEFGLQRVEIPDKKSNELLLGEVGKVGAAGNSGFQALNLAVQFCAKRILLVGFEASVRSGDHWYGRNNWNGANNPDDRLCARWCRALDDAAGVLAGLDIDVINTAPFSEVRKFKKMSIEQALYAWGLQVAA